MANLPDPQFKVGVSSGIYGVAHPADLASIVRKLGFALTRGTNTIELAADVPHEIDYTEGDELRRVAEKQNLTLLLHGSLTVPMAMPERGEWRDAQNHIRKSIRSAIMGGCKYVNFHACLNFWLEMMTYGGRKLTLAFCDHNGKFISKILYESPHLREWFVQKRWREYAGDILKTEENVQIRRQAELEAIEKRKEGVGNEAAQRPESPKTTSEIEAERTQRLYTDAVRAKLASSDEVKRRWDSEELRGVIGMIDGYHIMAHYLYYENDPIWQAMAAMYPKVIEKYRSLQFEGKLYEYSPGKFKGVNNVAKEDVDYWLDAAWRKAEQDNDREFKEFFYSVCAAKYIEGHISAALDYLSEEKKPGMDEIVFESIEKELEDKKGIDTFKKIAKDLKIAIEIPDARSAQYAGLYLICRTKQIYAAIKTIREILKDKGGDRLFMLIDFEHIATQGFDPLTEIKEFAKLAPDAGKHIISLHVTKPTPLHHHIQVEIGDIDVYKLLYELRTVGLGRHHTTYLIYERGGDKDPFKQSVTAIRLMVDQLEKDTKPEELLTKLEFFGVGGPNIASFERQRTIIRQHARDPIEGLLVMPEEAHTFLGKAATEKPGGAEKWKKEELS